ncbi:MAG: ubiquinone/menaquinone biosynthesis methyltransferase [Candidatus Omnitrophica bacterium]|nr:ubiquinone/menaquinone biosynthesis methyltransferase [Candidatus Omnitrophota bacterium]
MWTSISWVGGTSFEGTSSPSTTATAISPSPPTTGKDKDRFVRRLFDAISPRYDLFNRLASLGLDQGWRRRAVAGLRISPGMRVLDLASGTGDLAAAAAEPLVPLGQVVACDLSHPMLRFARRKLGSIPPARWHVKLTQARAEALPFSDRTFHAATLGFALRNVSDLDATFLELHRVLKAGGRIALLEFGRPRSPLLKVGHRLWLSLAVPAIGLLTTGRLWPFLYLRRSILQFLEPAEVLRRLEGAGFRLAEALPFNGGIVVVYQAEAARRP